MLADGTLIVADQRYGLAKIDLFGKVSPLRILKPWILNTIHPVLNLHQWGFISHKKHIITADVFNGKIYKTSIETESGEIIYSHKYGVNVAIEDSQFSLVHSVNRKSNEELFKALDKAVPDGALYKFYF